MAIAFFDLDKTLIAGDSDYLWGEFLIAQGLVDAATYQATNAAFFEDYQAGQLDMAAYLAFSLKPLAMHPADDILALTHQFTEEVIQPLIYQEGLERMEHHKEQGHSVVITTATNRCIAAPIASFFAADALVDALIATEVEMLAGQYTGRPVGLPNFQEHKVTHAAAWLEQYIKQRNAPDDAGDMETPETFAYSDSQNDIPLLTWADNAFTVNADEGLKRAAAHHGWTQLTFTRVG